MALDLRPNCEYCDVDLPPDALNARICTFECTFCAECVAAKLHDVCPNCGGGFAPRPVRPAREWRPGLSRFTRPASQTRVHLAFPREDVRPSSLKFVTSRLRIVEFKWRCEEDAFSEKANAACRKAQSA